MKRSLLLAGCALAAAFVMTGCMSTHTNDAAAPAAVTVKAPVFTANVVAGKAKVAGDATIHNLFGIISWGVSSFADDAFVSTTDASILPIKIALPADLAKQAASYNACAKAKADVILAAKYKLDIADYFVYKTIKCKVSGYPGTIKGVK